MRLVVAVHSREVKTAIFLALNGIPTIVIVAVATSTAELASYCRAFQPDVAIVESGLPGWHVDETLGDLLRSMPDGRILLIDDHVDRTPEVDRCGVEVFTDIDQLVAAVPQSGAENHER